MAKRDEPPSKIGHRKLLLSEKGRLRGRPLNFCEPLWRHVCRFIQKRAGRLWADIWPEVDQLLRESGEARHMVAEVRGRLHRNLFKGNPENSWVWNNSTRLHVDPDTGTLLATTPGRNARRRPQVSFSAADLRPGPELITR